MKSYIPVVWVIFLLPSCTWFSDTNEVTIIYRNFSDEIEVQQNLDFTFSHDLVSESEIGKWIQEPLIEIVPQVRGKFKWLGKNRLIFSPEVGFQPNTIYEAKLTSRIVKGISPQLSVSTEKIVFHTPYLTIQGAHVYWAHNYQTNSPEIRADLMFNYPVDPHELLKLLSVSIHQDYFQYELQTSNVSSVIQLSMRPSDFKSQQEKPILFRIKEGLCVFNSERRGEALSFESVIPSIEFRILQAIAEYDNNQEVVLRVYTNQAVSTIELASVVEVYDKSIQNYSLPITIEKLSHGFLIRGDFQSGKMYLLRIKKELSGIFQTSLPSDFEQIIAVGELVPRIAFASAKAMYLSNAGAKNVALRIVGISKITVTVHKIFENNIFPFIYNTQEYSYLDENSIYYPNPESYGNLVFSQELEVSSLKKQGNLSLLSLNLAPKNELENQSINGVYLVTVASCNEQWKRDTRLISISDIGLVAKYNGDEAIVFAHSIERAEPLENTEIFLISNNNQLLAKGTTDKEGVVRFSELRKKAPSFEVGMVTAQKGKDFTFLHFKQTPVNTSSFELGGMYENTAGLQAFLYGDRDLYRPDDDVFLKTIVRDKEWKTAKNYPIKLKISLPNGREFAVRRGMTNEEGTFETSFKIPPSAITGFYLVEVLSGNDILLASKNISVEEFLPDRIKVNISIEQSNAKAGGNLSLNAQAVNLFGTPAANRKVESSLILSSKAFQPKGWEEYSFSLYGSNVSYFEEILRQGQTDEKGNFQTYFQIPSEYTNLGMLEAKIYTSVFDENGRRVSRCIVTQIPTQEVFLGVKSTESYVNIGQVLNIPIVALNKEGMVYNNARARVQIVKLEWQTIVEKDDYGSYRYISQPKEKILQDYIVQISGKGNSCQFVPTESGEYQFRIYNIGASTYVMMPFYAYSWGTTSETSFEVEKDGKIAIQTDKEKYLAGETAKVLFKCPFDGRLIVTLERNRVFEYTIVQTNNRVAELSFKLKEEHLPNVFVSATLLKPIAENAIPLTVAHGYHNLFVEKTENQIELNIVAPEKVRSNSSVDIVVQLSKKNSNAEITIAVVDEGILQIKNYKTPNPYDYFYQKRALQVNSYDLYPRLFPEIRHSATQFGADGYDLGKRNNPLTNKRVKLASFWSGTLKTDSDGKVKYSIKIPNGFSGDLRIMAVAAQGKAFGAAEKSMKVADPLIVSVGVPRFLSPADEVVIPVTVSNTTSQKATVTSKIAVSGALQTLGENKQTLQVSANGEKTVYFTLKASSQMGTGEILVEAEGLDEKFTQKTEITVRPPSSLLKFSSSGRIEGGKSARIDLKRNYLQSSVSGKLLLTKVPFAEFAKEMNDLIQYPHGCLEQTISTAFPQLYAGEFLKKVRPELAHDAAHHIYETIRKIQSLQLYDGSLAYWQNGDYSNWWATVYAAHFLTEAQKAGFEVENKLLERLYQYLQARVKSREMTRYHFITSNNQTVSQEFAPREVAYSLYVLALAGKKDLPTMNYYKSRLHLLTTDARYMLAGAFSLVGDINAARKLQPTSFSANKAIRELDGSFSSYLRDIALSLSVLLETEPDNAQVPVLAKQVAEILKATSYPTTQELAFSLTALGKIARKAQNTSITAIIKADGKEIARFDGNDLVLKQNVVGKEIEIITSGTGNLFYFYELQGLNESEKVEEKDNFLQVRREFYDRQGTPINSFKFRQNDLIVVKLSLKSLLEKIENVVLTDVLPACFEIENPRLEGIELPWLKDIAATAQHIDYRDDRIHYYTTAQTSKQEYYYLARVTNKGKFQLGIVSADAMYNGDYHSYSGSGEIVVE